MTSAIETVVQQVEKYDTDAATRPVVYGQKQMEEREEVKEADNQVVATPNNLDRLKVVSGDLLDLWLFEGSRSLEYIKQSKAYKMTDPYVNYVQTFEQVKDRSLALGGAVQTKLTDLNQKCIVYYDDASKFVGLLVKVVTERQGELKDYVKETYNNVQLYAHQNWMRLDFNQDGKVDVDDIRKSL